MGITVTTVSDWVHQSDMAGKAAATGTVPAPMHIRGYEPIMDGVCGFAWVSVWPRNCKLANALKKIGWGSSSYNGVNLWVSGYGQSMEKKAAYGRAFADKLAELAAVADPKASIGSSSRMD